MAGKGRKGPGRYSKRVLPRKSTLKGRLARLKAPQANVPPGRNDYIMPGSTNARKC